MMKIGWVLIFVSGIAFAQDVPVPVPDSALAPAPGPAAVTPVEVIPEVVVPETRVDSYLVKNPPFEIAKDTRSAYERARDACIFAHVERVARMDALLAYAKSEHKRELEERVETLYRRENQRFRMTFQTLYEEMHRRYVLGREMDTGVASENAGCHVSDSAQTASYQEMYEGAASHIEKDGSSDAISFVEESF